MDVSITSTSLVNEAGQMYAVATTERVKKSAIDRTKETAP
jgi:hypothetical protein